MSDARVPTLMELMADALNEGVGYMRECERLQQRLQEATAERIEWQRLAMEGIAGAERRQIDMINLVAAMGRDKAREALTPEEGDRP